MEQTGDVLRADDQDADGSEVCCHRAHHTEVYRGGDFLLADGGVLRDGDELMIEDGHTLREYLDLHQEIRALRESNTQMEEQARQAQKQTQHLRLERRKLRRKHRKLRWGNF